MFFSKKGWLLVAATLLILGAALVWFVLRGPTPQSLLAHLPSTDQPILFVNAELLRKTGVLSRIAGAQSEEDAEYRKFVDATGFNFRRDLDGVALAWRDDVKWIVAAGRFDQQKLAQYAVKQGGRCIKELCTVQGSAPDRQISFMPLDRATLALAVGPDPLAVAALGAGKRAVSLPAPASPAWAYIPKSWLKTRNDLPLVFSTLFGNLEGADYVLFSANLSPEGAAIVMDAPAPDAAAAKKVLDRLSSSTNLARGIPVLAPLVKEATFRSEGSVVKGRIPFTLP